MKNLKIFVKHVFLTSGQHCVPDCKRVWPQIGI